MKYVLVDLDGCLVDSTARDKAMLKPNMSPDDWDAYHIAGNFDKPNHVMLDFVCSLSVRYWVVIVTARPEKHRVDTKAWLRRFDIPHNGLYMRPDGDFSPAPECKMRIVSGFRDVGIPYSEIALVLDDHPGVIEAFNQLGVMTMQVRLAGSAGYMEYRGEK